MDYGYSSPPGGPMIGGIMGKSVYDPMIGGMFGQQHPINARMMYMNGFNQLNTIEEDKHETQTSNYFREGDSERDDSRIN